MNKYGKVMLLIAAILILGMSGLIGCELSKCEAECKSWCDHNGKIALGLVTKDCQESCGKYTCEP